MPHGIRDVMDRHGWFWYLSLPSVLFVTINNFLNDSNGWDILCGIAVSMVSKQTHRTAPLVEKIVFSLNDGNDAGKMRAPECAIIF